MRILLILILIEAGLIWVLLTRSNEQPALESSNEAVKLVLAVSWQPAFCEKNSRKPECRSQTAGRFDTRSFSLHGLWPQPRSRTYCGAPPRDRVMDRTGKWASINRLDLGEPLRQELQQKMPGYQSFLHRHEWVKHGTCLPSMTTEEYFRASLKLLDDFNNSSVRHLFEANIGSEIDTRSIRRAMDKSFGRGTGNRLRIACRRDGARRIITELTIGLTGNIEQNTDIASLISSTGPTDAGCPGGFVDAVGYQ